VWLLIVLATVVGLLTPSITVAATLPNPPTGLGLGEATETSVTITWTPSTSTDVVEYEAFLGSPSYYTQSASVGASSTSVTFTGLQCGSPYTFSVVAVDASGNVSPTDTAALSTLPCQADVQVVLNTPSVADATIGQNVTFTIVARNNGPDAVELFVNTVTTISGLAVIPDADTVVCDFGISNDGSDCEYGLIQPGETVTQTDTLETVATSSGYAAEVACARSPNPIDDPNPLNDCGVATVKLDQPAGSSGGGNSGGESNGGSGGVVVTGSNGSEPQPQTPVVLHPPLRVCAAYTFVYRQRAAGPWQRTVRVGVIMALDGNCRGSRILIERANAVFSRTQVKSGIYVNVSSWRCRQLRMKGAWLDDCWQGPRMLSWSETIVRAREPAIGTQ
jgi:uncharacterized repeat protein (TIGR01451 family)